MPGLNDRTASGIIHSIHSVEELRGCSIGLYYGGSSMMLHQGNANLNGFNSFTVIVEIRDINSHSSNLVDRAKMATESENEIDATLLSGTRSHQELMQAGVSCGFALLSGITVAGSAAATGVTGGLALVVTISAWTGFVTSAAQCGNGLYRAGLEWTGQMHELKELDENPIYGLAVGIIDSTNNVFGWVGIGAAGKSVAKQLALKNELLKKLPSNFSTLSGKEKKVVVSKVIHQIYKEPNGPAKIKEVMLEAGIDPRTIERRLQKLSKSRGSKEAMGSYSNYLEKQLKNSQNLSREINKNIQSIGKDLLLQGLSWTQGKTKDFQKELELYEHIHIDLVPLN